MKVLVGVPSRRLLCLTIACLATLPGLAVAQSEAELTAIEQLLDAGQAREALGKLRELRPDGPRQTARLLLLRSTAYFMIGEVDSGRRDLDAALERDPTLRQGWLNRAGLEIAEGRLEAALAAFDRARELDPSAPDNDLNRGAVLVMLGRVEEAHTALQQHLSVHRDDPEAWFLVASNYALGEQAERALAHLEQAISRDERMRLRARTDPNFGTLESSTEFQLLLQTDSYRVPAGSHAVFRTYEESYFAGSGKLLPAVLDALQLTGEPFDRQIEVAPDWALIWGEMRIKVRNDGHTGGRVELTAPRDRFSDADWKSRTSRIFAEIAVQLARR